MTKEMFKEITEWQKKVFTQATPISAINHLKEEANELTDAINDEDHLLDHEKRRKVLMEYADCFLLLFGSASLYGLCYEDVCDIINSKMEINRKRKWGRVNAEGYVKHIEP